MDIVLAALGFFSAVFFSGAIFYKLIFKDINKLSELIVFSFIISLVINFFLVYIFVLSGIYNKNILLLKLIIEIILFLYLYSNEILKGIPSITIQRTDTKIIFYISVAICLLVLNKVLQFNIFSAWDAVVSWNRWAVQWAEGKFVLNESGYPQLYPILISISYVLSGRISDFQGVGVAIYWYFAFVGITSIFFIFDKKSINKSLLSLLLCITTYYVYFYQIKEFYVGYVDLPVSMLILISALCLFKIDDKDYKKYIIIGAITAGISAELKQSGILWSIFYILGMFYFKYKNKKININVIILCIICILILIVPWIVIAIYSKIILHTSATNMSHVMGSIHENRSYIERFILATKLYNKEFYLFLISSIALFMRKFRFFALMGILYYIMWACLLSYSIRNLQGGLPMLIISLSGIIYYSIYKCTKFYTFLYKKIALIFILLICIGSIILSNSQDKILRKEYKNKLEMGGKETSKILKDAFEKIGEKMVVTDNQLVAYTPWFDKQYFYLYHFGTSIKDNEFENFIKDFSKKYESFYILMPQTEWERYKHLNLTKIGKSDYYILLMYKN